MQKIRGMTLDNRRRNMGLGLVLLGAAAAYGSHAAAQQPAEPTAAPPGTQGVELYVSQDALQALYDRPMQMGEVPGRMQAGLFVNDERDYIGMVDWMAHIGAPNDRRLSFNVGPRGYAARMDVEDTNVFGVALGGEINYQITANGATSVTVGGFYAPSILTAGDVDEVRDAHARVEQRVADGFDVFVGYRLFEWEMTGPGQDTRRVDDSWQIGVRGRF